MSEYTGQMLFSQVVCKEVVADFDGGDLTSDGGLFVTQGGGPEGWSNGRYGGGDSRSTTAEQGRP